MILTEQVFKAMKSEIRFNKESIVSGVVLYAEKCEPKVKTFKSYLSLQAWVAEFLLQSQMDEDSFIDCIISGELKFSQLPVEED